MQKVGESVGEMVVEAGHAKSTYRKFSGLVTTQSPSPMQSLLTESHPSVNSGALYTLF